MYNIKRSEYLSIHSILLAGVNIIQVSDCLGDCLTELLAFNPLKDELDSIAVCALTDSSGK